jgi:hypothetical protein
MSGQQRHRVTPELHPLVFRKLREDARREGINAAQQASHIIYLYYMRDRPVLQHLDVMKETLSKQGATISQHAFLLRELRMPWLRRLFGGAAAAPTVQAKRSAPPAQQPDEPHPKGNAKAATPRTNGGRPLTESSPRQK